jgi:hypothetical protein
MSAEQVFAIANTTALVGWILLAAHQVAFGDSREVVRSLPRLRERLLEILVHVMRLHRQRFGRVDPRAVRRDRAAAGVTSNSPSGTRASVHGRSDPTPASAAPSSPNIGMLGPGPSTMPMPASSTPARSITSECRGSCGCENAARNANAACSRRPACRST